MNKNILIITSGSSQLITQIALLKQKNIALNQVKVLYFGARRLSLDVFFNEIAKLYGLKYLGQIDFNLQPKPIRILESIEYLLTGRVKRIKEKIESKFPNLKKHIRVDLLLIPVRVKMFSDVLLLSYIKPRKVLFTADGVIDQLPERKLSGFRYIYLKNYLKKIPLKQTIFSPSYLVNDMKSIGKPKEVSIDACLESIQQMNMVKQFKNKFIKGTIDYVILSQHYHLHENISIKADISYYKLMIDYALKNSVGNVIFKPHPRDIQEKIEALKKYANERTIIVDDNYKAVPIEVCKNEFEKMQTKFLTGNSSAPLYFSETNEIQSIISEEYLHEGLTTRIKEFSKKYKTKLIYL